jgi:hypothetical protein
MNMFFSLAPIKFLICIQPNYLLTQRNDFILKRMYCHLLTQVKISLIIGMVNVFVDNMIFFFESPIS